MTYYQAPRPCLEGAACRLFRCGMETVLRLVRHFLGISGLVIQATDALHPLGKLGERCGIGAIRIRLCPVRRIGLAMPLGNRFVKTESVAFNLVIERESGDRQLLGRMDKFRPLAIKLMETQFE